MPLIIHGKWKAFAGLQIHPKTTLTRKNKRRKARRQGALVRHVKREGTKDTKTRNGRRRVRHVI